ncbi:hypothetical protein M407DRAFT_208803 [Tulasnella calospora MUT 4182]|uniref:Aspartate/glutamate/uridylate kinase domain-containing protein n=1 Tax=Tulasnella calospora MUT 4182 TaxID=1051891 RepID=A0A0C3Q7I5_9AGAM|nr:hypothetical protein M407DRAFT_208803 [Tulasnella calospora MUT 4182]
MSGRKPNGKCLTVVIKLGTSSIVHETTHQPLISLLSSVVETVVRLRSTGHRVVLVSSGAIGVGLKRMELPERPKHLSGKQALAAIGQGRLIALWDNLFGQLGQPIAQILLTRGDISDRSRYLNAVNTLTELLSMGVVPIINENDTVSVSEIRFGDNDTLSAVTSSMLHADYLFLLTDVDCLYTSNPRKDPGAKPIEEVTSVSAIRSQVSTSTLGSKLGTGGMETKLIAAEIATGAGVSVIITSSRRPETIFDIIQYNQKSLPVLLNSATPSAPQLTSANSSISVASTEAAPPQLATPSATGTNTPIRPPHTLFRPSSAPLTDLKSWTAHTLYPAGSVVIDSGAHNVLSRRESGGRLLAVGVLAVQGTFAAGQAVRVVIRKPKVRPGSSVNSSSLVTVTEPEAAKIVITETTTKVEVTTEEKASSASPPMVPEPDSPHLKPLRSHSSSMSSMDPLSRSASLRNIYETLGKPAEEAGGGDKPEDDSATVTLSSKFFTLEDISSPTQQPDEGDAWETVEVGRGLANYNSADIAKVRGAKSSQIQGLVGYADSEYVVENITIRVLPSHV